MYAKTMLAAAAVIAQAAAYSGNYTLPACWSTCFAKYQVDSENCLCSDSLESVVTACVDSGCSAASSKAYEGWLYSYCNKGSASASSSAVPSTVTIETTSYTTICPVTETQTSGSQTLTSSYTTTSTIVSTTSKTVPVSYSTIVTSGTWSTTAVVPKTTVWTTSSSSESSTWATTLTSTYSETSTIISTYTSTKTPGYNTWTSPIASGTGTWATSAAMPSGTGVAPYPSAPWTGGAANVKVAGALVGAGAFAALFL